MFGSRTTTPNAEVRFEVTLLCLQVIWCWDVVALQMRVGEKAIVHCNSTYGYGEKGRKPKDQGGPGGIPPNVTMTCVAVNRTTACLLPTACCLWCCKQLEPRRPRV